MAITFPAGTPGAEYTNPTTGVKYYWDDTDEVWKTHVWPTNTDYLQLSGGTLTGDLSLGTNDLTAQDINSTTLTTTGGVTVGNGLTVSDGNVVMAAGHGIDFSATANGSGTVQSELLDDYEEGIWTPTIDSGTISQSTTARYTKVGRLVTISAIIYTFSDRTSTSDIRVQGLPYAPDSLNSTQSIGPTFTRYVNFGSYTSLNAFVEYSNHSVYFYFHTQSAASNYTAAKHQHLTSSSSQIRFQVQYLAAA